MFVLPFCTVVLEGGSRVVAAARISVDGFFAVVSRPSIGDSYLCSRSDHIWGSRFRFSPIGLFPYLMRAFGDRPSGAGHIARRCLLFDCRATRL